MKLIPSSVQKAIEEFGRLPGIGPRTAERLVFYLLRSDQAAAQRLGEAVAQMHDGVERCQTCFNLAEGPQCNVCSNPQRDRKVVAVVEEPLDVVALEKTGVFQGLYHVLGGVISPLDGIGPDQLTIRQLIHRIENDGIEELIIATNPVTEGEATAMYIRKQLESSNVAITRLARGLPVGGDLEYADQITLGRALQGRQKF